jgi:hypothetical protein
MAPDRKHPSVAFWLAVALVAVLVGYPLSIGPAYWTTSRCESEWLEEAYDLVYAPLFFACDIGPKPIEHALIWYVAIWRDWQ